jgi:DNA-binding Lrp family transcriptional regulator
VTDEEILDTLQATSDPVLSTAEVAEALPIKRRGVLTRLRSLEEASELDSKQIGGRNTVWWYSDEAAESRRESDPVGAVGGSPDTTLDADEETLDTQETPTVDEGLPEEKVHKETTGDEDLVDVVREFLEENDRPPKNDHGRALVTDALRYLREHDTAKTGEIREALAPAYADRYSDEKAMWESVRRYLVDIPGIEKAGDSEYRYAGDEAVQDQLIGEESGIYDPTEEFQL